jgi:hypothetical protein
MDFIPIVMNLLTGSNNYSSSAQDVSNIVSFSRTEVNEDDVYNMKVVNSMAYSSVKQQ